jgi:prepilin-type N-terminal cleavage/methylation domain-containing protein
MSRPHNNDVQNARGFSLLEVLIATTIVSVSLAALAELCTMSTRANSSAKTTTYAVILAQQKMEHLRSLTWGFDAIGLPLTDTATDTTVVPERNAGGKGLSPSPINALLQNTDGYVDYLDTFGHTLGGGVTPSEGAVYIRRWSIEPLPSNPDNTIVIQVLVTRRRNRGTDTATGATPLPDEARLISVKTRKAP